MSDIESVKVLTRFEALSHLGLSDRTLIRMERRGDAPPKIRLSPGRIGYRVSDLQAWMNARRDRVSA